MYGDKPILGQYTVKVDEKRRIFIPASTDRKKGEELVLVYDPEIDAYRILKVQDALKDISYIESLIDKANSLEERMYYKLLLVDYQKKISVPSKVDGQGRIVLDIDLGDLEGTDRKVSLTGAKNHLILTLKK